MISFEEHAALDSAAGVAIFCKGLAELVVPASSSLLQAIKGLIELAHLSLLPRLDESGWLGHVDGLCELSIKVCIIDIYLVYFPIINGSWGKDHVD